MSDITSIQKAEKFEIEKFSCPKDIRTLSKTHSPYSGSPQKHPLDADKIILIPDPYNEKSPFLEFSKSDVTHVENWPTSLIWPERRFPWPGYGSKREVWRYSVHLFRLVFFKSSLFTRRR